MVYGFSVPDGSPLSPADVVFLKKFARQNGLSLSSIIAVTLAEKVKAIRGYK